MLYFNKEIKGVIFLENQYVCRFDIDLRRADIEIKLNGDGQEVLFKFMVAFFSFPSFLFYLLQL